MVTKKLKKLYEKLMIDTGEVVITKWGTFVSTTARANAWICTSCGFTPYNDPINSNTDIGIHAEGCQGDNYYDDCSCNENEVPLIMWGDNAEWQLDFCLPCAQKLNIYEDLLNQ